MITARQFIAPAIVFGLTLYGILLYQDIQFSKTSNEKSVASAEMKPAKASVKTDANKNTIDTSKKKLLENAEKASFDEMSTEANTKVNSLGAEINTINREATAETTKMYQESTANPLDTGFVKGRSFTIAQKKNQRITEVYKKQIAILEALLRHPYATKAPESAILKSTIIALQNKAGLINLESAKLNAENQTAIARDAESVKVYAQNAEYKYQKQRLESQAAREAMVTADIEARYKSALGR
jgi:hypothetical protein